MAESGVLDSVANYARDLMDERVKLVRWHRRRACERQGIPYDEDVKVPDVHVTHVHQNEPPAPPVTPTQPVAQSSSESSTHESSSESRLESVWSRLRGWQQALATVVAALALLGGGSTLYQWWNSDSGKVPNVVPPTIVQPDDGSSTAEPLREGSLLQWLEDQGEHLSNGGR